jgi:beta-fructofuranosidase
MALRYKSDSGRMVADLIPFYDRGHFHVFYLKGFREGSGWARHQTPWGHLRSRDLLEWEVLPNALETGLQSDPDGGACFTGSVIRHGETVHIFYTGFCPGHPNGREQIMHAVSDDGVHFEKDHNNPVLRLGSDYYGYDEDFRDPFVFWREEERCYWMLFTAGAKQPLNGIRRGVVGLAVSEDLLVWTFMPPIYAPDNYPSLECSDMFRIGEYWYLLFSQYGRTEYRISDSPRGPWTKPPHPHFDAGNYFFYAAKSCTDGENRYLFGWCGELEKGTDAVRAMWGGTFVTPRKILQAGNGELFLSCPPVFDEELRIHEAIDVNAYRPLSGKWSVEHTHLRSHQESGFSACFLPASSKDFSLRTRVEMDHPNGMAGLILRSGPRLENAYLLCIDFGSHSLRLERYKTIHAFHGSALDGERILCERLLPSLGVATELTVFLQEDILEVFLDGITLTVPLMDIKETGLGLFTCDGSGCFSGTVLIEQSTVEKEA